ncbi:MAG: hypothetical protein DRJ61_16295, partial [Acidobacteria bacterium]
MGRDDFKDRLVSKGAEVLADALLDLVGSCDSAELEVLRLISNKDESLERFERGIRKVRALRRSSKFYDWRRAGELGALLQGLLRDLEDADVDPRNGVKKVVRFFGIGPAAMESCDDSSGIVSDFFRYDATELLAKFARECDGAEWLEEIVLSLHRDNDYGLNDNVIDTASAFLPEPSLRRLVERCWALNESEQEGLDSRRWLWAIGSLAKQLRDPFLFERVRRNQRDELLTTDCVEIAEVNLLSGRPTEALSWLDRVPENDVCFHGQKDQLTIEAHLELGDRDAAAAVAEERFSGFRSLNTLEGLLSIVGEEQRQRVIKDAARSILSKDTLVLGDLEFLIDVELADEAETYVIEQADQVDGKYYPTLTKVVGVFEASGRALASSIIFRALLMAILDRANSRAYSHAVRYLKKLDTLAEQIEEWNGLPTHDAFSQLLREKHRLKRSFWGRYGEA